MVLSDKSNRINNNKMVFNHYLLFCTEGGAVTLCCINLPLFINFTRTEELLLMLNYTGMVNVSLNLLYEARVTIAVYSFMAMFLFINFMRTEYLE